MSELIPYTGGEFVYPKGKTYWGQPFPYLVLQPDGKKFVKYDGWWTPERFDRLSDYLTDAEVALFNALGTDGQLVYRAQAKVRFGAADVSKMLLTDLWKPWRPTAEEQVEVARLAADAIRDREYFRDQLRPYVAQIVANRTDVLPDPDRWGAATMAAAILRIPSLLLKASQLGWIPYPDHTLMPEGALA